MNVTAPSFPQARGRYRLGRDLANIEAGQRGSWHAKFPGTNETITASAEENRPRHCNNEVRKVEHLLQGSHE